METKMKKLESIYNSIRAKRIVIAEINARIAGMSTNIQEKGYTQIENLEDSITRLLKEYDKIVASF